MKPKRIYVCCGTGIATSTVIVKKLTEFLKTQGIANEISQYIVSDIPSKVKNRQPDLIVSSTQISGDVGTTPIVLGRAFLTGIGKEKMYAEILEKLNS